MSPSKNQANQAEANLTYRVGSDVKFLYLQQLTKIFFGGFPLEMDEMALVELVVPFADVVTIKLVRHRDTKICKGYGFIEVADEVAAQNAIYQLNGTVIGDRVLSLNMVSEKQPVVSTPVCHKVKREVPAERPKRPRRPRL